MGGAAGWMPRLRLPVSLGKPRGGARSGSPAPTAAASRRRRTGRRDSRQIACSSPARCGSAPPKRWEPVVVRRPGRESELVVKRLVGLPGETVELRHGDLYIDGRLEHARPSGNSARPPCSSTTPAGWLPAAPEAAALAGGRSPPLDWRDGCLIHPRSNPARRPRRRPPRPDWPIRSRDGRPSTG